mgnify:CR=1 FL=1|jgi:protein phosphatase
MKNHLNNIIVHTHQGRRDYQEDSYAHGDDYVMVADGVGGLAKGNIASGIVVRTWQEAFETGAIRLSTLKEDVKTMVQKTIDQLMTYASENPESSGMGSTLACAAWIDGRLVSIHVGDSRVYHYTKTGHLKWRSKDHSLVQELVDGGIITEEDAATHPRRNVITRVLQAKEGHETKAAIHVLDDIEPDDIIMVCSDGINESWVDSGIASVIMGHNNTKDIVEVIGAYSADHSGDNNTLVMANIVLEAVVISSEKNIAPVSIDEKSDDLKEGVIIVPEEQKEPITRSKKGDETVSEILPAEGKTKIKRIWVRWAVMGMTAVLLFFIMDRSCTPKKKQDESKKDIGSALPDKEDVSVRKPIIEKSTNVIKPNKASQNKGVEESLEKEVKDDDQLVIIEDKVNEDTLYHLFKNSRKLKDAKMYLKHYPKGKHHQEINNAIAEFEKSKDDKEKGKSNQK